MLNWIWLIMVTAGVALSFITGNIAEAGTAVFAMCETAVMKVMLPLGGAIVLWMGLMRLIERSGLIMIVARIISPVMRRLFPEIPRDHPAHASIALNLGASMLGGGNAATPLGLRAMQQMNELNPNPGIATNSMCLFLAMNSCAITVIPATTISQLQTSGSVNPMGVVIPAMLTTIAATFAGIIVARLAQGFTPISANEATAGEIKKETYEPVQPQKLRGWKFAIMLAWLVLPLVIGALYVADPTTLLKMQRSLWDILGVQGSTAWSMVDNTAGQRAISFFSWVSVPYFIGTCVLFATMQGLKVYEEVVEGGKEGMATVMRVIPYVVAMLVAISIFRVSGALKVMEGLLAPLLHILHFPAEVLPMAIVRPLSGGAARGVLDSIIQTTGPNSLQTMIAATINGSTETTFYVAAVYFGSVGIRRMRHALAAGLAADAVAMLSAVFFCSLFYKAAPATPAAAAPPAPPAITAPAAK